MNKNEEEEQEKSIANECVYTKYVSASTACNNALKAVIALCVADASVRDICKAGDKTILDETAKVFRKDKNIRKGIAFPTCLSVNNCIAHYSPLDTETDTVLAAGDLVKIDMGAHVDGYIGVVAHTVVVPGTCLEQPIDGRKADVVLAAHHAFQAALRVLRPEKENSDVTEVVTKVCAQFDCRPVDGLVSHQLKQNVINGSKTIVQSAQSGGPATQTSGGEQHEKCEFEPLEVYALDVVVSTGEGVARQGDARTSVFMRSDEPFYSLKLKASREFVSQVSRRCGTLPFNLRALELDCSRARMALVECQNHRLIEAFHVLYERPGRLVAQFKATVLVMPCNTKCMTGAPLPLEMFRSQYSVREPGLLALLQESTDRRAVNRRKKKKAAVAVPDVPDVPDLMPVAG